LPTLSTPEAIRTFQRKLYRKAKSEPGFRFYSLYDKVYRADVLDHAYNLVRANKGAAGIDGRTCERIEGEEGKTAFLAELEEALRCKTYSAQAVRRVLIPKPQGGQRPLGIPTVRDRVVQTAVKLVIEPIFEADFCDNSYGFRPKRSAHDAVDDVAKAMVRGHRQVIDADLSKYFDSIPHWKLLKAVAERVSDKQILHLIKLWLTAPVQEEDERGRKRMVGRGGQGTPQGGVISPLLANIYLHILDRVWERQGLERRLGARLVRYADDVVILCRGATAGAMKWLEYVLGRLSLTLNADKTRTVNAYREGFEFLGFSFQMRRSRRTNNWYPHVEPSRRSRQRIKDQITALTHRRLTLLPLEDVIANVNPRLRGWVNFFHYKNCSASMGEVKRHVEERLRIHLRKRHQIRNWKTGYQRFPTDYLYREVGLYKVPTTAAW
jgi:group II intron reverse transcriptase/maturase